MAGKKVASKTKIKKVIGKANGKQVEFGNFDITSNQAAWLMDLAEDKECGEVMVTIEQVQQRLPGT